MKKNPNKQLQINPNWAQLQQKLKSHGPKPPATILGDFLGDIVVCCSVVLMRECRKRKEKKRNFSFFEPIGLVEANCSSLWLWELNYEKNKGVTDEVAMDCEMVGVSQGNKSALGRVTLVNKWGNIIYDEFVRPLEHVVDFRTQISGIRPRDLRKAKDFRIVQKRVAEFIKGRILVGHALRNDLKALLLSHPKEDLRDTLEYEPFMRGKGSRRALRHLAAEFLDVQIQNGEHCPVEDARAAMVLYQKNKKAWEKRVKDQIKLKQKQKKRKPKKKRKEGDDLKTDLAETAS